MKILLKRLELEAFLDAHELREAAPQAVAFKGMSDPGFLLAGYRNICRNILEMEKFGKGEREDFKRQSPTPQGGSDLFREKLRV
jgi:hypothetical protein